MPPTNLSAQQFTGYPPEAKQLALAHLAVLQKLPLSFLPGLLRELIEYDYKFPAERAVLEEELASLNALNPKQIGEFFQAFSRIRLSPAQERFDWISQPAQFTEQLSAYLWSTHQIDAYREAATMYGDRMRASTPPKQPPVRRLGIAVIGQGVPSFTGPLFRNLRAHGTYFSRLNPASGLDHLLGTAAARAQAHPAPYGHWYIDGGAPADHHHSSLTCISYANLAPARDALLKNITAQVSRPGMGPEELRNHLAQLSPRDLGMTGNTVLDRFQLKVLTEGSGTQIFSTTFAQWSAREILRRAEPLTLLVRFAPRQRERPMDELLSSNGGSGDNGILELDPVGSLIDADMAAYYQWINQQRLPGSEQSSFLAWFEGQGQAVAIGPSMARGTESKSNLDLKALLSLSLR